MSVPPFVPHHCFLSWPPAAAARKCTREGALTCWCLVSSRVSLRDSGPNSWAFGHSLWAVIAALMAASAMVLRPAGPSVPGCAAAGPRLPAGTASSRRCRGDILQPCSHRLTCQVSSILGSPVVISVVLLRLFLRSCVVFKIFLGGGDVLQQQMWVNCFCD